MVMVHRPVMHSGMCVARAPAREPSTCIPLGSWPSASPAGRVRGAFSLIEVLLVAGIIVLVLAMLMPVMRTVRRSVNQTACAGSLRHMAMANIAYSIESRGRCIPFLHSEFVGNTGQIVPNQPWYNHPYLRSALSIPVQDLDHWPLGWACRESREFSQQGWYWVSWGQAGYNKGTVFPGRIYGMNFVTYGVFQGLDTAVNKYYVMANVKRPSETFLFSDSLFYGVNWGCCAPQWWDALGEKECDTPGVWFRIAYRHRNRTNLSFFDGHVETLPATTMYAQTRLWTVYTN
jgi:prepilin-type processing-associated H-X9-DG protein